MSSALLEPPVASFPERTVPPPASTKKTARGYIPSLDGLRAVSILIVFLSHAGLSRVVPGLFGVTVFFFLSGYLITTLLRQEWEKHGRIDMGQFFIRRALRIFPPFYLALAAIAGLTASGALAGDFSWQAIAAQALFGANYWEIGGGVQSPGAEVLWSLAVEEHFYLVFPWLYIALLKWVPDRRHQARVLVGLCAAVLAWRFALVHGLDAIPLTGGGNHHPRTCHGTDTRFDALLFGCILAIHGNPVMDPTRFSRRAWIGIGLPVAAVLILASLLVRDTGFRETLRYTLQGVALFPVFIATIRYADAPVFRWLNWKWVRFLGVLSYAFYLAHSLVIACVHQWLPAPAGWSHGKTLLAQGAVSFVLSLGIAVAVHHVIEKPLARLRKRFSAA